MDIAVFGLGKIGSVLSAVLAGSGHRVFAYDIALEARESFLSGCENSAEPGLSDLLATSMANIVVVNEVADAVRTAPISFIIVPTPSDALGGFDSRSVQNVVDDIREALAPEAARHTVVVCSTVMPGTCRSLLNTRQVTQPRLQVDERLVICYSPFFIALGSVIRNMTHPDFVLLGADDELARSDTGRVLQSIVAPGTRICNLSLTEAEVVKLAVNSFVTMKISFANLMSEFCSSLGALNARDVLQAIGADTRIGNSYLSPGLGFGGPCFPRDNLALSKALRDAGCSDALQRAVVEVNDRQPKLVISEVLGRLDRSPGPVAVLGLAYKPDTNVTEASQGLMIAQGLHDAGVNIWVHDPALSVEQCMNLAPWAQTGELPEVLDYCRLAVLAVPWPEYLSPLAGRVPGLDIVDPWGFVERKDP